MALEACLCLKQYRKPVIFANLAFGFLGVIYLCYLSYFNRSRRIGVANGSIKLDFLADDLNDELKALDYDFKIDMILYLLPSLLSIALGTILHMAVKKESFAWSRLALSLNILLIGVSFGIIGAIFISGTHWTQLVPITIPTCAQCCFITVVYELFRSTQYLVKLSY